MAWRIADYVTHGEIDNRSKGRVTARMEREGHEDFDRIMDEKRDRSRRERGER